MWGFLMVWFTLDCLWVIVDGAVKYYVIAGSTPAFHYSNEMFYATWSNHMASFGLVQNKKKNTNEWSAGKI